jgi:hypothetical protein
MPFGRAGMIDIAAAALAGYRGGDLCCYSGVVTRAGRLDALGLTQQEIF